MLNLILFAVLFFILVFSTFFVIQLPFIVFMFSNLPPEVSLIYSDKFIKAGYYSGNLQIPAIILSSLLLNPRLSFFFMLTYFSIGFSGYPIFYSGGGAEYLSQPAIGYLLAFFPVVVLLSKFAWKDKDFEKYLFNSRYIFFISLIALLLIHIAGVITAWLIFKGSVSLSDIIQIYFSIPVLSQILLIAIVCIFATNFNRLKFYLLSKNRKFLDNIFKSTKRSRKISEQ